MICEDMTFAQVLTTFCSDNQMLNDCMLLQSFREFLKCTGKLALLEEMYQELVDTVQLCSS